MFPAMMILGNLARRMWRKTEKPVDETPRFDFSQCRDAYEQHATPTDDMRVTNLLFRKRR